MKNSVIIPSAIQICVDDLGWFNGADARHIGRPSRTGMVRAHAPEDYTALNEIGKAIGQRILCPFVIGEWDKDNILRGEYGTTYEPDTWNRAATINMPLAERCFEEAEKSEYIEYAFHGVLHGNYDREGRQITEQECFSYKTPEDKKLSVQSEEEIAHRFELFFKIYDSWGFKKKIRAYAAPNSVPAHLSTNDVLPLANIISSYGFPYWVNSWKKTVGHTEFINDILYMEKCTKSNIPWNACDVDPLLISDFGKEGDEAFGSVMSTHWPNFLRFHKEYNLERVDNWAKFFKKQSDIFGLMTSKDIAFAGNQFIYRTYSKVYVENNTVIIDVSKAASVSPRHTFGEFYVSLKNDLVPIGAEGGVIELYETHTAFKTYKVTHSDSIIRISLG